MRTHLVRIGNSKGIRLPKAILEQTGLSDEVEIGVEKNQVVLRPARRPRAGWARAFASMAESGDDELLHGDTTGQSRWDREEWEWR